MRALYLIIFAMAFFTTEAQIIFDLSDNSKTTEAIDLSTKPIILFKSLLPSAQYSFDIDFIEEDVQPFNSGLNQVQSGSGCPDPSGINTAVAALTNETNEKGIPAKLKVLEDEITKSDKSKVGCIDFARNLIASTNYNKDLYFKLQNNQTITITVKKKTTANGKDSTVTWTKVFKTPSKSPWVIHYGLSYQPNIISKYDQFYSQQIGRTDSFYVTKKHTDQSKFWDNMSPTIMFTYPFTKKKQDILFGFTALVSTNFTSLSGGCGLSAIIGTNVVIGTGINFSQKSVLRGEYKTDGTQVVRSNFSFDQLHEKKWGPELYLTIGFRFDKNPFSGDSTKPSQVK